MRIYSILLMALLAAPIQLSYPTTRRVDVEDVMHGVHVADPYRWLEDLETPETRRWIKAQDDLTRSHTEGAAFQTLRARIDRLANVRRYTTPIRRGDRWFFFETDSNGLSGRVLMVKELETAPPRPLVDLRANGPNALSRIVAPSADGKWVAYGESIEESRWLRLKLISPEGTAAPDTLDDLHSSMGNIAWSVDGRSFYYVRFNPPRGPRLSAEVAGAVVMRHLIGTTQKQDARIFALDDSPHRIYSPQVTDDGRWLVITTSIGAGGSQQVFAQRLGSPTRGFVELFRRMSGQFAFLGSQNDLFWFDTSVDAPRHRIVRVDPNKPAKSDWQTVVAEPGERESITYANLVADRLIVMSTRDAAPLVRIHTLTGELERELHLPSLATVWGPSAGGLGFVGRANDAEAYYSLTGIADPGSIYRLDPRTGQSSVFLRPAFGFDPSDFVGRQVFYTAKDGTRVPMFIAHHKLVRPDGERPAFMYGYGALMWSAFPWFQPQILAWMEMGGVYALPGIRGGGEYGESWHEAAVREKKQTSVDDYISAAEWLIANKYAAPNKLVANGGSISGTVAAAAVVQRPELFGAAVIDIPALDLLRYDRYSGAAAWIPEFGSTAVEKEFRALQALSPYHNVKKGLCYPGTIVLAGEKDDIAVPSHAYKFVAALQHTQSCPNPALLQVAWGAGHTFGTTNESSAENWARQLTFVGRALGLDPDRPKLTASVLPEVRIIGRGPTTMVLIPCMSCRWVSWEPFMARNADRWRMYAVTLPGFGGTPVPDLPRGTDEAIWQANAVAAVDRLLDEENPRDVVLVGHSFGASIALQVAARHTDRVRALVNVDGGITSPRSWFSENDGDRVRAAQSLTAANAARFADAEAWRAFNTPGGLTGDRRALYHGMFMATPRDVVFQYWRENLLRDLSRLLQRLTRPVLDLKMIGPADPSPDATRAAHLDMMRAAGAPSSVHSAFVFNSNHFAQEQRPARLEDAIAAFLDGRTVTDATPARLTAASSLAEFGYVERSGTGSTPLILMPCLGCDWRAFDEYLARNAARHRMFAVTWPGMGDTVLPRAVGSSETPLLDNVIAATVRLIEREHLVRPILLAHSAAGPVAIRLAAERPDLLGGVITIDATIQNHDTLGFAPERRREWADAQMAAVLRDYDDDAAWAKLNTASPQTSLSPERVTMYERMWRTPPREHVLRYWHEWLRLDSGALLPTIRVPTLALFALGATDGQVKRQEILDQFAENNSSATIAVEFIQPATHFIWETTPNAFDQAVDRFVSAVTRRFGRDLTEPPPHVRRPVRQ